MESLNYCESSLDDIRKKIFEIESQLLPAEKEKQLKKDLKRFKVIEGHLVGEVVKLRQLSLFQEESNASQGVLQSRD
jgi:hypothetical protein